MSEPTDEELLERMRGRFQRVEVRGTVPPDPVVTVKPVTDTAMAQLRERDATGRLTRRGGPEPGYGVTSDEVVAATCELYGRTGEWPKQATVAQYLHRSVERVQQVIRPWGGWRQVVIDAKATLCELPPGHPALKAAKARRTGRS